MLSKIFNSFIHRKNPLLRYQERGFSQIGQEGILKEITARLGIEKGTSLEIGAWDGVLYSNTRWALLKGWSCVYIEADKEKFAELKRNTSKYDARLLNRMVSLEEGENFQDALFELELERDFSLMVLDIDSNEYWLWKSLEHFTPKIVCIEYNCHFSYKESLTVPYHPRNAWQCDDFYGASAGALYKLARQKGYSLVAVQQGYDLFFVLDKLIDKAGLLRIDIDVVRKINMHKSSGKLEEMIEV